MDLSKVLAELHAELADLDAAIASLERIEQGGKRRGRPPLWLAKARVAKARASSDGPEITDAPDKPRQS